MYMMFPLCVLGAIVVSSMLVKAFFVGLPSYPPPSFFFLSFSPHYMCSYPGICKRPYAKERVRAPQWKPFLAFTRVIYHQTVFFFLYPLSLFLFFSFFFSLPPSFFHRFLVTVGCAVLYAGPVKREK